jgi:hypothetical protein
MRESERTNEIGPALVGLVKLLNNPPKRSKAKIPTKKGGEFSYNYLNLPDLLDAIRPHLITSGLAVLQGGESVPGGVGITTRIVHISGQWIETGPLPVPADADPKAVGSAVTYGCRYSLCAVLGIAGDEDDDGASAKVEPRSTVTGSSEATGMAAADGSGAPASDPTSGEGSRYGEGRDPSLLITPEQIEVLKTAAGGVQKARAASKAAYSKDWRELTVDEALKLIQQLQKVKEDAA